MLTKIGDVWGEFKGRYSQKVAIKEFEDELFRLPTFLILIILASAIASLGLIRSNIAVVIGAMIITPLVSPFVGLGLSVTTMRWDLFKKSLSRIFWGTLVFYVIAFWVGIYFPEIGKTSTLIKVVPIGAPEYLIAIFAGMVAALAISSEKIYNRVSGAAIALALAPPMAVSAIGLSLNKFDVFQNGLTIFAINAAGLVVMGILVFSLFGFRKPESESKLQ